MDLEKATKFEMQVQATICKQLAAMAKVYPQTMMLIPFYEWLAEAYQYIADKK